LQALVDEFEWCCHRGCGCLPALCESLSLLCIRFHCESDYRRHVCLLLYVWAKFIQNTAGKASNRSAGRCLVTKEKQVLSPPIEGISKLRQPTSRQDSLHRSCQEGIWKRVGKQDRCWGESRAGASTSKKRPWKLLIIQVVLAIHARRVWRAPESHGRDPQGGSDAHVNSNSCSKA
jgi:hypothetical protein